MKLPKSFITVTPLSKTIALAMFIILPIAAFFYGMYCQRIVDMGSPPQTIVEYKFIKSHAPQSVPLHSTCHTNSDCSSGYFCAVSGPIVYNPVTKSSSAVTTCHKNGTAIPL